MKKKKHSLKGKLDGLVVTCHDCGTELPLLHPHIMVERSDDDRNPICEICWIKKEKKKQDGAE